MVAAVQSKDAVSAAFTVFYKISNEASLGGYFLK
jgi:hypothetical protein